MEIQNRAILVKLSISSWAAVKQDREASMQVIRDKKAESSAGSFKKKLVDSHLLRDFNTLTRRAQRIHQDYTLPWLDNGYRILPSALYLKYRDAMREVSSEMGTVVDKIVSNRETIMHHAKQRLGEMYKESEFPSADELRSKFGMDVDMLPVPTSNDWRVELDNNQVDELRNELETKTSAAQADAMRHLWNRLHESIQKMVDRLENDGKLHESTFDGLRDLVDLLPDLNIDKNPDMDEVAADLRLKLRNVDLVTLRKDDKERARAAGELDDILKRIQQFSSN